MRRVVIATVLVTVATAGVVSPRARDASAQVPRPCNARQSIDPVGVDLPSTATWQPLPQSDVDGRSFASTVWTGDELIVWGGEAGGESERRADGSAYSPATNSWRRLPRSGIAPRSEHVAVWTGRTMLVWGGAGLPDGRPAADAAAYDPVRRRWRPIPRAPIEATEFAAAAWTGDEMLVWGGTRGGGTIGVQEGAAYDPVKRRWRRLAPSPLSGRRFAASVWTGCELLIWGGESAGDGAAYRPSTNSWRMLPTAPFAQDSVEPGSDARPVPLQSFTKANLVWTGERAVLWGYLGSIAAGVGAVAPAATYDPVADRWELLPPAPIDFASDWEGSGGEQAVWAGDRMIVTTGNLDIDGGRTLALDIVTGSWTELPAPPGEQNYFGALIATPRALLAWGQTPTGLAFR